MASRQFFIPSGVMPISGVFINADDNGREFFIPGLGMFNEEAAAVAAGDPLLGGLALLGVGR